jgi:hypothetical protein
MSTASKGNRKACEVDALMLKNGYKCMAKEHRYRAGRFPKMCNVDGFDRLYGGVADAVLMEICDEHNLAAHRDRITKAATAHWSHFRIIIATYPKRIDKRHNWRFYELRNWLMPIWDEVTAEFAGASG